MATPSVQDLLRVPGRLSANPSSLTTAYPHGGTALGIVRFIAPKIERSVSYIRAEEYANERVEGVETGEGLIISAILSSYDKDMIQRVFMNTAAGAVTGKRVITSPGAIRGGHLLSSRAIVLLFTPDDTDRHHMVLMRRALPAVQDSYELSLRLDADWGVGVVFAAIRDANSKLYDWGIAADLTL